MNIWLCGLIIVQRKWVVFDCFVKICPGCLRSEDLVVGEPLEPIKDGDVIQLVHGISSRALNSHDVAAAVSPHNQEVAQLPEEFQ